MTDMPKRFEAKGRQVDEAALAEVRALLGPGERRRDLLIEYLHLIQDRYRHISHAHLAALAAELKIPMAEAYEVATFYAHFDVVREGQAPPPALTVWVCDGISCALAGAGALLDALPTKLGEGVRVVPAPCMGRCDRAPAVAVGRRTLGHATPDSIAEVVAAGAVEPEIPPYADFETYRNGGGYRLLEDCLAGRVDREALIGKLEAADLRGLGGAGFPAGRKWRFVLAESAPRIMALNANEGEPGTFKDRHYLETDPHRVLEGMLVAAWAVAAGDSYIYLRDEYPHVREILRAEIPRIESGLPGAGRIHLRRGAGAYICGEDSAMLESIEGKRGLPRHKPPFPAQVGLFTRPTLVHNVETVYWLRAIVEKGPEWFASQGTNGSKGLRSFSVSGRVRAPGVKVAPAGITARQLIEAHCGGMAPGHGFKAYLPGGASGGILPASMADLPLDFGSLDDLGCFVGSHALVVLSDQDDMRQVALNLMRFFEDENCGQCTPCRAGTEKAAALMECPVWDRALLEDLCRAMADASICGLGEAAPNPLLMVLRHFPEEVS